MVAGNGDHFCFIRTIKELRFIKNVPKLMNFNVPYSLCALADLAPPKRLWIGEELGRMRSA